MPGHTCPCNHKPAAAGHTPGQCQPCSAHCRAWHALLPAAARAPLLEPPSAGPPLAHQHKQVVEHMLQPAHGRMHTNTLLRSPLPHPDLCLRHACSAVHISLAWIGISSRDWLDMVPTTAASRPAPCWTHHPLLLICGARASPKVEGGPSSLQNSRCTELFEQPAKRCRHR
jgi:hypothetical protein